MTMLTRRPDHLNAIFDRMLSNFFTDGPIVGVAQTFDEGTLALDISEDDTHVIVRASLPGFRKEDVDVELHDGVLTIMAQHSEEHEEKSERFYRRERRIGSLSRRLALPGVVSEGNATAELRDGVLTVRVARAKPEVAKKLKID